jgi:ATP-binding cassette subfamily B protein
MQKESKTVIVIAHRLSTINLAQRIIVLDKGQIVQDGSFEELSITEGPFRSMWQHQTLEFIEPIQNKIL